MNPVVVLEPDWQAFDDGLGVWRWIDAGVIAFDRSHQGLGHAVGLWARHRGRERLESEIAREAFWVLGDIA